MAGIPGDPFSSFASSFGSGLGKGVGDGIGAALGGDAGPNISSATSATYGTKLGNDGFVVNFGTGLYAGRSSNESPNYPSNPMPINSALTGTAGGMQAGYGGGVLMLAFVAFVAIKLLRKG